MHIGLKFKFTKKKISRFYTIKMEACFDQQKIVAIIGVKIDTSNYRTTTLP